MTTSGVQVAGLRSAKMASAGARAGNRAAGGTSFSDMMSVGTSAKKDAPSAQTKVNRAQDGRTPTTNQPTKQDATNTKEVTKTPEMTKETKENPQGLEEKVKETNPGDMPEGEITKEPVLSGDLVSSDSGEDQVLDTDFVKSLKLFRETSKLLEMQKLGELKQAIMDSLQVDEEDLEQLLEQVGTNMQGLLQPQLLQQLVVAAECDGDPMKLLTDESAMNTLNTLLEKAGEIRNDLLEISQNMEIPELGMENALLPEETMENVEESDFAQVLAKAANPDQEIVETKVENTGKKVEKDFESDMPKEKVEGQKEPGFTFEAVRESGEANVAKESLSEHADSRETKAEVKTGQTMGDQFLNFVADAAKTDEAEFAQLSRAEQVRAVADQILEKVRVVLSDKQTSMEISLTPESLGRVTLNLVSRHGALTAHFTAQNEVAKEAIQSQMVVLRENLESQGLKVEAIEVTVSNFDFTQNGGAAANGGGQENRQRSRRGLRFDESINDTGLPQMSEAEQIAADLMERSGNQVDYTA